MCSVKFLDADVTRPLASVRAFVDEGSRVSVWNDAVVHRARAHGPDNSNVSKERVFCLTMGCATEHEAAEVRDIWRTSGQS